MAEWKLMPAEPTPEMIDRGAAMCDEANDAEDRSRARGVYMMMYAAPSPSPADDLREKVAIGVAVSVAMTERDHWIKEASKHTRPSGRHSDYAARDLERARIATRIVEKLRALQPMGPGHVCEHGTRWPHQCDECDIAALHQQPGG